MVTVTLHEFTERAMALSDAPKVCEMLNAASIAEIGRAENEPDKMSIHFQAPGFDLGRDTLLIETPDGRLAGMGEVWDVLDPHVRAWCWGTVHPDFYGQGVGRRLLEWIEDRGRWGLQRVPEDLRVSFVTNTPETNQASNRLLVNCGWNWVRQSRVMQIEMNAAPAEPELPAGIEIRAVKPGEEALIFRAIQEAFRDHWGAVDEPFEAYYERMIGYVRLLKSFDYSLWFAAFEGDEVCGSAMNLPHIPEDPDMGWVDILGVRRPWRKQGLGLALLQQTFGEFYRRGTRKVGLGVDAHSLTGATRLYERAGMKILRAYNVYEKEFRAGKDLTTQSVEA